MGTTRAQRRIFSGIQKARRKIAALGGDEPKTKELAAALEVPEEELKATVSRMSKRDVSLDQPMFNDSASSFGETLEDEAPDAEAQLISTDIQEKVRGTIDGIYDELAPRERYLIEHRLLSESPSTLEAVGHEFGVSRERVRQIEERLKKKLRKALEPAIAA